jgi:hypothetical protein
MKYISGCSCKQLLLVEDFLILCYSLSTLSSSSSLINTVLGHLLNHSGLTCLEISLVVSPPVFLLLLVCVFSLFLAICYNAFCSHFATCSSVLLYFDQNGLYFFLVWLLSLFSNLYKSILLFSSYIFHLYCCYSSCISCFNDPIFTTVWYSCKGWCVCCIVYSCFCKTFSVV